MNIDCLDVSTRLLCAQCKNLLMSTNLDTAAGTVEWTCENSRCKLYGLVFEQTLQKVTLVAKNVQ